MKKIKTILCVLALVGCVSQTEGAFIEHQQEFLQKPGKLAEWESMSQQVNSWTEEHGKSVDENIKETVIALNLLGFKTLASCEGHLDSGYPYPWVVLELKDPKFDEICQKHDKLHIQIANALKKKDRSASEEEALQESIQERTALHDQIKQFVHMKVDPLHQLLADYYQEHSTSYENTLYMFPFRVGRLSSLGGDYVETLDGVEKAEMLQQLQEEMATFTDYLIVQYLNQ